MKFNIEHIASDVADHILIFGMETEGDIDEDALVERSLDYVMEGVIEDKYKDSLLIMMNRNDQIREAFDDLYARKERGEEEAWESGLSIAEKMRSVGLNQNDFL